MLNRRYQPTMTPRTTPLTRARPKPIVKFFPLNARSASRFPWVRDIQNCFAIADGPLKNSGEIQFVYDQIACQMPTTIKTAVPPRIVPSCF